MPNRQYGNTTVVTLSSSKSPSQKIYKSKYKNTEKNIENTKQYFESLVIIAQNISQ